MIRSEAERHQQILQNEAMTTFYIDAINTVEKMAFRERLAIAGVFGPEKQQQMKRIRELQEMLSTCKP